MHRFLIPKVQECGAGLEGLVSQTPFSSSGTRTHP